MKRKIVDVTLLCSNNKMNFLSLVLNILHLVNNLLEKKKWQHFTHFIFENDAKVEILFILVLLNRWNVEYYEHRCIFYSVTQEKVQTRHFTENNKTKTKANYQPFLSQRQFSLYYSLDLKKIKKPGSIFKSEHRQNVCIFIFRIKTLQTAVTRVCYPQSLCVSVCMCAVFSKLHGSYGEFSVSYCWDKRRLCRLGAVGASWDCSHSRIYF